MIAVIADIHSNLEAFERVLGEIRDCDLILNAGDIVGYNANPNETIELIRKNRIISVKGNHDYACISDDTFGFNPYAAKAVEWTMKKLTENNKKYLNNLPTIYMENIKDKKIVMVHGSPEDYLNDYVFPEVPEYVLEGFLRNTGADILILANTHAPFIRKIQGKLVLNPGSVGQPRDSNPKASFAFLDLENLEAKIRRIEYNVRRVQEKILKAGLPKFLAERLEDGE
jgi:putative phosphoesterase